MNAIIEHVQCKMTLRRGLDVMVANYEAGNEKHVSYDFILWKKQKENKNPEDAQPEISDRESIYDDITLIIFTSSAKLTFLTYGNEECKNETGLIINKEPTRKRFEMNPGMG